MENGACNHRATTTEKAVASGCQIANCLQVESISYPPLLLSSIRLSGFEPRLPLHVFNRLQQNGFKMKHGNQGRRAPRLDQRTSTASCPHVPVLTSLFSLISKFLQPDRCLFLGKSHTVCICLSFNSLEARNARHGIRIELAFSQNDLEPQPAITAAGSFLFRRNQLRTKIVSTWCGSKNWGERNQNCDTFSAV